MALKKEETSPPEVSIDSDTEPVAADLSKKERNGLTIRLCSVAVMSKEDQQKLDLLLDQFIENRVDQILRGNRT